MSLKRVELAVIQRAGGRLSMHRRARKTMETLNSCITIFRVVQTRPSIQAPLGSVSAF